MKTETKNIVKGTPLVMGWIQYNQETRKEEVKEAYEVVRVSNVWKNGVIVIPGKPTWSESTYRTFYAPSMQSVEILFGRGKNYTNALIISEEEVPYYEQMVEERRLRLATESLEKELEQERRAKEKEKRDAQEIQYIKENMTNYEFYPVVVYDSWQGEHIRFDLEYRSKLIRMDFTYIVVEDDDAWGDKFETQIAGFYERTYLEREDRPVHFRNFSANYVGQMSTDKIIHQMVRMAT